ncbi:MAG: tripartite tricarboxylate transporter substrate binding protein [Paracoccaceae bacterium]|nr:tripartite tricarboxylate transporter substrate binding protein [Paracoccaceae bacterium]
MRKVLTLLTAAGLGAVMMAGPATAEDYPEKSVEMTVLFGGTANSIAQVLTEQMGGALGQPVVPVSRPGGGGAVGYSYVQGTQPDGYNIVWNSNSINTSHHTGKIPFDYTAFEPVAKISSEVPALAVRADSGWSSLADLKAAAESMDGTLKVGISGKGSFTHLTSAALFDAMGIGDKVTYISYGDGKAPVELMGARIDAAVQWPGQYKSYVDAGELNVLAVTGTDRVALLPDVPTAAEQGVDIDITMWRGIAVPKGTDPAVIDKLEAAAKAAVESEAFMEASKNLGFNITFAGSEDFGEQIAKDDEFYAKLLTELGMKQ